MYVPDITVSQKYKQDTYMYKQDTGHAILFNENKALAQFLFS